MADAHLGSPPTPVGTAAATPMDLALTVTRSSRRRPLGRDRVDSDTAPRVGCVRDPGRGSPQAVRSVRGARGVSFGAETGTVLGLLGPERRRQDDGRADPHDAAAARRRHGPVAGLDVVREPARVRARIGLAGPVRRRRREPDRPREPRDGRAAVPPAPPRRARTRARELLERLRARRRRPSASSGPTPAACAGGSTSPPRCRAPAGPLPRRADDGPRPAQPHRAVGPIERARRRRARRCCSRRSTSRRPTGSPTGSR